MYFFLTLIIWELNFKVQTSLEALNFVLFSSSPFKLLSMASYGGELLLDSSSTWSGISIHLSPSPFHCNQTLRSKGIHWWRRSKAYKLHMELHHIYLLFFTFLQLLYCFTFDLNLHFESTLHFYHFILDCISIQFTFKVIYFASHFLSLHFNFVYHSNLYSFYLFWKHIYYKNYKLIWKLLFITILKISIFMTYILSISWLLKTPLVTKTNHQDDYFWTWYNNILLC